MIGGFAQGCWSTSGKSEEKDREYEGLTLPRIAGCINTKISRLELRKKKKMPPESLIFECISGNHTPRVIQIGYFHGFAVIKGKIYCSSEKFAISLNMENIRKCSDFIDADFNDLEMTEHREGVVSQSRKRKLLWFTHFHTANRRRNGVTYDSLISAIFSSKLTQVTYFMESNLPNNAFVFTLLLTLGSYEPFP